MATDETTTSPPTETAPATDETAVEAPARPNYHVSLWDEGGPQYVCLLCLPAEAPHLSLEAIKEHMPTVHDVDAVPTWQIPSLLQVWQATQPAPEPATTAPPAPPVPEEAPDAGRTDPDVP